MRTLPTEMIQVLAPFAPLFSKRVWRHVQVLLTGAILAPGKRTVASALRAVGLRQERCFCRYHRVLSRAVWSSRQASRILLGLLVEAFAHKGPLVVGIDETLESGAEVRRSPPRASTATQYARAIPTSSKRALSDGFPWRF
jgi:DDE superfamily endonuclease